jgi:hypothetical protein
MSGVVVVLNVVVLVLLAILAVRSWPAEDKFERPTWQLDAYSQKHLK